MALEFGSRKGKGSQQGTSIKDPDLGWVLVVVSVKTGAQKLGLRVWPRDQKSGVKVRGL